MTEKPISEPSKKLLHSLARELFQTETSAVQHSQREADRLGQAPPAVALRAVAEHARSVLDELPGLAERENLPLGRGGVLTGTMFSELRDKMLDMVLQSERSYRGTLLGMRHGLDVVRMLLGVAESMGKAELRAFCEAWLDRRKELVQRVEEEMRWFAQHPEVATLPARPLLGAQRAKQQSASSSQG